MVSLVCHICLGHVSVIEVELEVLQRVEAVFFKCVELLESKANLLILCKFVMDGYS